MRLEAAKRLQQELLDSMAKDLIHLIPTRNLELFLSRFSRDESVFAVNNSVIEKRLDEWSDPVRLRFVKDDAAIDGYRLEFRAVDNHDRGYN